MSVKLTTLVENSVGVNGLLGEHGLSILVEANGARVLLDTGQTEIILHNAGAMGVDLTTIDAIVISHGHGDHAGGLKAVLRELRRAGRDHVPVYAHPDIWQARYSRPKNGKTNFAGVPHREDELTALGAQFRYARQAVEVAPGIQTTGEVPRQTAFERPDPKLQLCGGDGGWRQDEIVDDQSLIVRTPRGLVMALGCAHSGAINTLRHAQRLTGERRIVAVVGGTHLVFSSAEQLRDSIVALGDFGIERIGVSHCTGLPAAAALAQAFGDAFFFNAVGTVTVID